MVVRAAQLVPAAWLPMVADAQPVAAARIPVAPVPQGVASAGQPVDENGQLFVARALLVVFGAPEHIPGRVLALVKSGHERAGASFDTPAVGSSKPESSPRSEEERAAFQLVSSEIVKADFRNTTNKLRCAPLRPSSPPAVFAVPAGGTGAMAGRSPRLYF
jgi:hypothetical protein